MHKKSYAKINLFLKVVGRKNGYHQLESLMAFLDLRDEILVEKSEEFSFEIDGEFASEVCGKNNILTKILDFFAEEFSVSKNLAIKLTKNIPVGAGLGGGSSNGCEFIKILNEIFELGLSREKMREISLKFGSDIAFFFEENAAIIKGRGQIIEEFPRFEPFEILLINPKINLSTKDVFENFGEDFSVPKKYEKDVFDLMKNCQNDLTKSAIEKSWQIKEILEELEKNGAKIAKMSGSGATCFGIFGEEIDAVQKKLAQKFPQYFIRKTWVRYDK